MLVYTQRGLRSTWITTSARYGGLVNVVIDHYCATAVADAHIAPVVEGEYTNVRGKI